MTTDRALYEKMYAAQLAEGHDLETAMRFNKASTPEDFLRAFGESSDPRHQHRKWGGGNKMGSGGAAVNAARRARAEARRSAPDANVNNYTNKNLADRLGLTALSNFVDSRVNDVQGKFMPSQPSFGFSQKTLNEAGARGADSSFAGDIGGSVYGGDMSSIGGIDGSLIAGDPNRGLNRGKDYGVGDSKEGSYGYTTDSDFGKRMREAVLGIPIQASIPRFAGIFAV